MGVTLSQIAKNPYYDSIWRFWIRRMATIFFPFIILAYCNAAIVYSLNENGRDKMIKTLILFMTVGHSGDIENIKSRVRAATRMLIIIVSCYLCTNIVDVFIATWEYVDAASLSEMSGFYTVATDVSSLLSVTGAALRLPIYIANDDLIRREVAKVLHSLFKLCRIGGKIQRQLSYQKQKLISDETHKSSSPPLLLMPNQNVPLQKASSCSMGSYHETRTTRLYSGIGSLIMARASVVSSRNGSLATNLDMPKCTLLYENALLHRGISPQISTGSIQNPIKIIPRKIPISRSHYIITQDENNEKKEMRKVSFPDKITSYGTNGFSSWSKYV
uniref:G-protein coupled receptors family 1 profile domain-containing protein n=1 Tax=Acrobeloides nanus TaxID=290746 RepID=A0A914DWB1_9BILA